MKVQVSHTDLSQLEDTAAPYLLSRRCPPRRRGYRTRDRHRYATVVVAFLAKPTCARFFLPRSPSRQGRCECKMPPSTTISVAVM